MLLVFIRNYLKSVPRYMFLILNILPIILTLYIYVSKDPRILGYFLEPKVVREQKGLGKTGLEGSSGMWH